MKKSIVIISIVLVLAVAAYFLFRKPAEAATDPNPGGGTGNDTVTDPVKPLEENPMPLRIGAGKGAKANALVKDIQNALNTKYNAGLIVDGSFGPKTLAALLKNGFGGVIFWKQYSEITGKALEVAGEEIKPWWNIF